MHLEGSIDIDGVRSILFMPDAISYLLTGKEVCEYTILSTSQLMNPETCRIEERLLEPLQIPVEKFPPVVMPGRIIGNLRDDVAAETRLSAIPVVAVAGHDTASAVAAVPASGRNFAYLRLRHLVVDGYRIGKADCHRRGLSNEFHERGRY